MMLVALAPVCFAQASPAKPAKSASNEKAITDLEKSAWESYKNRQADAFKKLKVKQLVKRKLTPFMELEPVIRACSELH